MLSPRAGLALAALAVLFSGDLYNLFAPDPSAPPPEGAASESAVDRASIGGKVHISFCGSCSYKGAFMQVQKLIQDEFPGTEVIPSNYPVAPAKMALAKLAGYSQMGLLAVTFAGDKIFPMLGMEVPEVYQQSVSQNKFGYGMGIWFLGNAINNGLMSTGAFEVYYDGDLVFSKLGSGRMPFAQEIVDALSRGAPAAAHEVKYS